MLSLLQSMFLDSPLFNNTNHASVKMTVPVSERHDGTAGTGARIVRTAVTLFVIRTEIDNTTMEYVEVDGTAKSINVGLWDFGTDTGPVFNGNIVQDFNASSSAVGSEFE